MPVPQTSAQLTERVSQAQAASNETLENDSVIAPTDRNTDEPEVMVTEQGVKYIVHPSKLMPGGPPPDGIPSIDSPKFISAEQANEWLGDEEFVLGIEYNGILRAYPHQILVWHEIVNDNFNEDPVLITYCPLCFTGIAFERIVDGEQVEFGTSGKLLNSDLVMYDRKTRSYWSQITGQAIVGELSGMKLNAIPLDTIRWVDWKNLHPDTKVLSRDTGHFRNYGADPYGGYYTGGGTIFPVDSNDNRLQTKAIVFGLEINGASIAYPEEDIAAVGGVLNHQFKGVPLLVFQLPNQTTQVTAGGSAAAMARATRIFERSVSGRALAFELANGILVDESGSEWSFEGIGLSGPNKGTRLTRLDRGPHFWFAWSSFFPETELYQAGP
ncbi:MAG: DUF3179 domain-containing protein [Candidatus Bathyarchaeia archaeon]